MSTYLIHYGIKGQKWGVRRYQNDDGSLTPAGRNRYGYDSSLMLGRSLREQVQMRKAQKIASQLNKIDKRRLALMDRRQRQSFENAKKYWEAKAVGDDPDSKRNFIQRTMDQQRSRSFASRAVSSYASNAVFNTVATVGRNLVSGQLFGSDGGIDIPYQQILKESAYGTAGSLAATEILNRLFGHF